MEAMRILVVDDDLRNRDFLGLLLRRQGYEVCTAEDGRIALDELLQAPFDLVVTDILMPRMDGFELCKQARQIPRLRSVPFVFLTATYTDPQDEELARRLGANQFLRKPLENRHLLGVIQDITSHRWDLEPGNDRVTPGEEEVLELYNRRLVSKLEAKSIKLEREVAARRVAETQLRESRDQLRALSAKLQDVREEERSRIAREVHDRLGQEITGLKLLLSSLRESLASVSPHSATDIDLLMATANHMIDSVRSITTELHPAVLDLGLSAAIEWQVQAFEDLSGIHSQCAQSGAEPKLDRHVCIAVFRVFQEILTNISRHAGAGQMKARLEFTPEFLQLHVHDDGRGITPEEVVSPRSLGILGMRERLMAIQGHIEFNGTPDAGTQITVNVPLRAASTQ